MVVERLLMVEEEAAEEEGHQRWEEGEQDELMAGEEVVAEERPR